MGYTVTGVNPTVAYETDIREIADLLPFKLDYIIFDACFMGGVEVAYQFKDKCRYMCFSQTEILSDGMDYTTMISDLLEGNRACHWQRTISIITTSPSDPSVQPPYLLWIAPN